jgi:translation initiation factor 1 (eIF-1/SUI1)
MNPFEDIEEKVSIKENIKIEIWVEEYGRKKNTFISGWNLSDSELKVLKKKCNCNGTIKELDNLITDTKTKVVLLQGDHSKTVKDYMIANGINKDNIRTKG